MNESRNFPFIFLLSAFAHLDSVNSSIKSGNQVLPMTDAHIRFERVSEVVHKSSGVIEEVRNCRVYFSLLIANVLVAKRGFR